MFSAVDFSQELKTIWDRLFKTNKFFSTYSSYEYACICRRCLWTHRSTLFDKRRFFYYRNDVTGAEIIAPLAEHNCELRIYGYWELSRVLDFVYSQNVTDNDFKELFTNICQVTGIYHFCLEKLLATSKLQQYILSCPSNMWREIRNRECVKIDFEDGYDEYIRMLSTNSRRNLRVAYRRLNDENKQYALCVAENRKDRYLVADEAYRVYRDRQNQKYRGNYYGWRYLRLRYTDSITRVLLDFPESKIFLLKIDGDVAAVFMGFVNQNNEFFVPRGALNVKYAKYSAGKILISEMIKWFCKNSDIRCLDLSNGDEPYKIEMGGVRYVAHYCYELRFDKNGLGRGTEEMIL